MAIYDCTPDGGGSGGSYVPGNGIAIDANTISAKLSQSQGNAALFGEDGGIFVPESNDPYAAGDGIEINGQSISAKISPEPDNVTQIYNGAIYTPATFQTTVSPTVVVTTNPATPSIQITATKGAASVTAETNSEGVAELTITAFGTWDVSGTVDGKLITVQVPVSQIQQYNITLAPAPTVFGAIWDGSADPKWSRTDGAELFSDPQPAVNNGTGSSPFDEIMPWAGMTRVTDPVAGEMVQIPKYWYKWTRSGASMQLQIANGPVDGFYVSPAHADRGDGQGERDVVYVGRYHCDSSYKSTTGVLPVNNITRATARSSISALGAEYWQYDFAMYWTIMMLYLVEFANWNSQNMIGYGCSPSGSIFEVGLTDNMQYHTGTSAVSRTTYGCCQYRNIEGLWDNVYDWCDGIYFSEANVYCIKNPASFSDTSGGIVVGTRVTSDSSYTSGWTNPTADGFEYALYPNAVAGSESTFVCDYCGYVASGVVLGVGGDYSQSQYRGAFYLGGNSAASNQYASIGCRLQKLPNAT